MRIRIVLDTNVLVAASRSRSGASFAIVASVPAPEFEICLSNSLYLEWQAVLTRPENIPPGLTPDDVLGFLRYLASQAHFQEIYFRWRPYLPDPGDDLLLELAFAAEARYIITHNLADFRGAEQLGVTVVTPGQFLHWMRTV